MDRKSVIKQDGRILCPDQQGFLQPEGESGKAQDVEVYCHV